MVHYFSKRLGFAAPSIRGGCRTGSVRKSHCPSNWGFHPITYDSLRPRLVSSQAIEEHGTVIRRGQPIAATYNAERTAGWGPIYNWVEIRGLFEHIGATCHRPGHDDI